MKKLYLAVFGLLIVCGNAQADRHAEFIRIECNEKLGFLDIEYNNIYGAQISDYFSNNEDAVYTYPIDDEKIEIMLLNGDKLFRFRDSSPLSYQYFMDYKYKCLMTSGLIYEVQISHHNFGDCKDSASYFVTVVEHNFSDMAKNSSRKIIDNLLIGCGQNVDRILITLTDDKKNIDVSFEKSKKISSFYSDDIATAITDKMITEKTEK